MIPRYSRPEMTSIWSDESRFQIWLDIELLSVEGWEKVGRVPEGTGAELRALVEKAGGNKDGGVFSVERTLEIEAEVKHDVLAGI